MFRLMRETRGQAVRSGSLLRRAWTVPRVGLLALGGEFPSPPTCGLSCRAVPLPLLRYNDGRSWSSSQTKTRGVFRGSGLCPDGF